MVRLPGLPDAKDDGDSLPVEPDATWTETLPSPDESDTEPPHPGHSPDLSKH